MSSQQQFSFWLEQLDNGAWIIGYREGGDDYGRLMPRMGGFEKYDDAEKYAVAAMRKMLRERRDKWAEKPGRTR